MACLTPIGVRIARYADPMRKEYDLVKVVCGKCPACVKNRTRAWAFRLMQEEKKADKAFFITLTYDSEFLPLTEKGLPTLSPMRYNVNKKGKLVNLGNDVTLFLKRLRKSMPKGSKKIIYYYVGEYGTKNARPHYHMIIFNAPEDKIVNAWRDPGSKKPLGFVHFGKVSNASIIYACKYIAKPGRIPMFQGDDRIKEFSQVSEGVGLGYLTPDMIAWHKADVVNRVYLPLEDGKKWALPRYYKKRIYNLEEKKLIQEYFQVMADQDDLAKTDQERENEAISIIHLFEKMYKENEKSRWI